MKLETIIENMHLYESPVELYKYKPTDLDSELLNKIETNKLCDELSIIDTFDTGVIKYDIYHAKEDCDYLYFVDNRNDITVCIFYYNELKNNGIQLIHYWNKSTYPETARKLFDEYLLKKFDYIMSDNKHTDKGKIFWYRLLKHHSDKFRYLYNIPNEKFIILNDIDNFDDCYNDKNTTFVISKFSF